MASCQSFSRPRREWENLWRACVRVSDSESSMHQSSINNNLFEKWFLRDEFAMHQMHDPGHDLWERRMQSTKSARPSSESGRWSVLQLERPKSHRRGYLYAISYSPHKRLQTLQGNGTLAEPTSCRALAVHGIIVGKCSRSTFHRTAVAGQSSFERVFGKFWESLRRLTAGSKLLGRIWIQSLILYSKFQTANFRWWRIFLVKRLNFFSFCW